MRKEAYYSVSHDTWCMYFIHIFFFFLFVHITPRRGEFSIFKRVLYSTNVKSGSMIGHYSSWVPAMCTIVYTNRNSAAPQVVPVCIRARRSWWTGKFLRCSWTRLSRCPRTTKKRTTCRWWNSTRSSPWNTSGRYGNNVVGYRAVLFAAPCVPGEGSLRISIITNDYV